MTESDIMGSEPSIIGIIITAFAVIASIAIIILLIGKNAVESVSFFEEVFGGGMIGDLARRAGAPGDGDAHGFFAPKQKQHRSHGGI